MATKRKLDVIDPAPSPRRLTRASARMEKFDGADACKKRTRCKLQNKGESMKERSDDSENVKRGKAKLENDDATEKQAEKDVRKKGSACKLMRINTSLEEDQKARIVAVGFGGLLQIKCSSIHEKLSSWLINNFNTDKSELVFLGRGIIKVDDHAVHTVFGIPMGPRVIDYEKKSGATTFLKFYEIFDHENDQKAPTFIEAEQWFQKDGKGLTNDKWLQHWLVFAISSFLCPTSSGKLCVRAFHAVAIPEQIIEYNWCQLVVERLIKGIREFKQGKVKFLSGCLFFLTILYLDSLQVGDLVDQQEGIRASVWTGTLVSKICSMDRVSSNEFGKLPLKQQYRGRAQAALIPPQRVEDFIDSNMDGNFITLDRDALRNVLSEFSGAINHCVLNLTCNLRQLSQTKHSHHQEVVNGGAGDAEAGTSSRIVVQRNKKRAKPNLETIADDEIEEESDTSAETEGDPQQILDQRSKRNQDPSKAPANDNDVNDGDNFSEELEDYGQSSSEDLDDEEDNRDTILESSVRDTNNSHGRNADSVDAFAGTMDVGSQSQIVDGVNQGESKLLAEFKEENTKDGEPLAAAEKQVQESNNNEQEGSRLLVDTEQNDISKRVANKQDGSSKDFANLPNESSKVAAADPDESMKRAYGQANNSSKVSAAKPDESSKAAAAKPDESSKAEEDGVGQKESETQQGTPGRSIDESQDDELEDLTPPTPASQKDTYTYLMKLGLLGTPPRQCALANELGKQLILEPPEFLDMPMTNLGEELDKFCDKESKDTNDIMQVMFKDLNLSLKEDAERFEKSMVDEILEVSKTKKSGRTKASVCRPGITRKVIAKRKVTIEREAAATSVKVPETSEKHATIKEALVAADEVADGDNKKPTKQGNQVEQPASGDLVYARKKNNEEQKHIVKEDNELVRVEKKSEGEQHDEPKGFKDAPKATISPLFMDVNINVKEDKDTSKVEKKNNEEPHNSAKGFMESKAFKDAPEAPSFSLGIDNNSQSPMKSTGADCVSDSILNKAYEQAMKVVEGEEGEGTSKQSVKDEHTVEYVHRDEAEELYKLVSKYNRVSGGIDTSAFLFKSNEVSSTAYEVARSMIMGRSLETGMIHIASYVLSVDLKRKKIISPWVAIQMMTPGTNSRMVHNAFNFSNTEYDMIMVPNYEPNKDSIEAQGHWFAMAINIEARKFQVMDSLRPPHNTDLLDKARRVRAMLIHQWNKVTSKHPGCTIPKIYAFELEFVEMPTTFKQFGIHDCGLFTIKAIQYWNGSRLPELIGYDEMKLRKEVLFDCINSSANEVDWRHVLKE